MAVTPTLPFNMEFLRLPYKEGETKFTSIITGTSVIAIEFSGYSRGAWNYGGIWSRDKLILNIPLSLAPNEKIISAVASSSLATIDSLGIGDPAWGVDSTSAEISEDKKTLTVIIALAAKDSTILRVSLDIFVEVETPIIHN